MNPTDNSGCRPLNRRSVRALNHPRHLQHWVNVLLVCATVMISLTGCASLKQKFVSGIKADVGLFADTTIAMLGNVDLSIDRNEAVFARRFFHENDEEEKEMIRLTDNMQIALRNVVDYSISLVSMAESRRTEKMKVAAYAEHLKRFKEDILYSIKMAPEQFDARIEALKGEPDFLAVLRAAQPLISAAVLDVIRELKELTDAVEVVANKMDARIDAEYDDIIQYQAKMEDEKGRILRAIEIVFDAYRAGEPNLKGLSATGSIWFPELIPHGRPSPRQLQAIGEHLQTRLDTLHKIGREIQPYWEQYRAAHRELDDLTDKTLNEIKKVRLILLVWVRAHQKMASGTVDPAQWFDFKTVPARLLGFGAVMQ